MTKQTQTGKQIDKQTCLQAKQTNKSTFFPVFKFPVFVVMGLVMMIFMIL